MADIIKVEHLSYVYNPGLPTAVTALEDVSFTVEEGDFVGIIGATGSGKSTLITHMNGLNKPTSGKIYIDGRDLWADPEKIREFRFLTGLVFQYPEYQLFEETCYKDIAFGPKNMGLDEAEVDRRVHEAADFVGLDPALLERSPFELSGGQKRRVALAGVLAMEPEVLVLDEPTAGLDPAGRENLMANIRDYHRNKGKTIILVSHSMDEIARNVDPILVLKNAYVHGDAGGEVTVTVSGDRLSVCNSGAGGALDADHIFERFYQGAKKEGSTGLGLSIVDAVCRLYGLRTEYAYINRCHCFTVHFPK